MRDPPPPLSVIFSVFEKFLNVFLKTGVPESACAAQGMDFQLFKKSLSFVGDKTFWNTVWRLLLEKSDPIGQNDPR